MPRLPLRPQRPLLLKIFSRTQKCQRGQAYGGLTLVGKCLASGKGSSQALMVSGAFLIMDTKSSNVSFEPFIRLTQSIKL